MVIAKSDRISAVLARDEALVEVFAASSPVFERLRSPAMRRTMARLVTVEQAARVARVDPDLLVERLNGALAEGGSPVAAEAPSAPATGADVRGIPPHLASLSPERIVELDVRDDLRNGREPFSRIMAARRSLPPGSVLRLRAIFEPVPLYAVMEKQGLGHWTERLADDDWRIWFHPAVGQGAEEPVETAAPSADSEEEGVVVLDVRGLEPPEPMVRTLEALERLPAGGTLVQVNERVPRFLLPEAERRGFTYEVREQGPELVRVFFRHNQPRS